MKPLQRILIIGPTHLGEAVLASPVVEALHRRFPQAELTLIAGTRPAAVYARDPRIHQLIDLDRARHGLGALRMLQALRQVRPDLLVDLRQTVWPLIWRPWRVARYVWPVPRHLTFTKHRYLWRMHRQLAPLGRRAVRDPREVLTQEAVTLWLGPAVAAQIDRQLHRWRIDARKPLVLVCPGAREDITRWDPPRFATLSDRLISELGVEVAMTGEPADAELVETIAQGMRQRAHNLVGLTDLRQLGELMRRAALVISHDSTALQVAGAVGARTLALFGPTDERTSGPTRAGDRVVRRRLFCAPCEASVCRYHHECMRFISPVDVFHIARDMLDEAPARRRETVAHAAA